MPDDSRRFQTLLECGRDVVLLFDEDWRVIYAGGAVVDAGARKHAIGKRLTHLVHPDDLEKVTQSFAYALANPGVPVEIEFRSRRPDGSWRWISAVRRNLLHDPDVRAVAAYYRDVTPQKAAEAALKQQAQVLEQVSESIISTDIDGVIQTWNKGAERLLGYTAEEAIGRHTSFLYAEEERDVPERDVIRPLKEKGSHEAQVWAVCKNGEKRRFHLSLELLRDDRGTPTGMVGYAFDVTDRYHGEQALRESERQLRELTARLQSLREEERRRIATEIHDDLGQSLTAVKMNLAWLAGRLRGSGIGDQVDRRLTDMNALIDGTLDSVRRIASELRLGVLDELGLNAALDWQVREVERLTNLKTEFWSSVDDSELDLQECSTPIYRICQEALTNVVRHAQAIRLVVSLTDNPASQLVLEVRDDGIGMTSPPRRDSLGLVSMKERAIRCGGDLEIVSEPGCGTIVRARIPVRSSAPPTRLET